MLVQDPLLQLDHQPSLSISTTSSNPLTVKNNASSSSPNHCTPTAHSSNNIQDHVFNVGLVSGQWPDTLLCVNAMNFAKVYPCHALILSRIPCFLDRLMALRNNNNSVSLLLPLGSNSGASVRSFPDENALASLGFVRGRDYIWRIDLVLPELASEDAMGMILSYIYNNQLPDSLTPSLSITIVSIASVLGLTHIFDHVSALVHQSLSLDTIYDYLPLLNTCLASLITNYLQKSLACLPSPILGLSNHHQLSGRPDDPVYIKLVDIFAQLPWLLLKSILEDNNSASKPEHCSKLSVQMQPFVEHGRFEFTKRVLKVRNNPDETAVVAFGDGITGVLLIHRAERKIKRRMWRLEA